jgi:hypothetical protein
MFTQSDKFFARRSICTAPHVSVHALMKNFLFVLSMLLAPLHNSSIAAGQTESLALELATEPTLVEHTSTSLFSFSQNSDFLLYADDNKNLKSVELATGLIHNISTPDNNSVSKKLIYFYSLPNGQIVYSKGLRTLDNADLFIANADGSQSKQISSRLQETFLQTRKLLANNKLIFVERRPDATRSLNFYSLATGLTTELKPNDDQIWDISYYNLSKDGSLIAFLASVKDSQEQKLFIANTDGSNVRLLLGNGQDLNPDSIGRESTYTYDQGEALRFSDQNNNLFFLTSRLARNSKSFSLNVINLNSGDTKRLGGASDGTDVKEYWVSDSNQKVIFLSGISSSEYSLWSVSFDGSNLVRLHDQPTGDNPGVQLASTLIDETTNMVYFQANINGQVAPYYLHLTDGSRAWKFPTRQSQTEAMGVPLWSAYNNRILVSSLNANATRMDLYALNLKNASEKQLNKSGPESKMGLFLPTSRNHVAFTATDSREKMDLFLVNLDNGTRFKINHSMFENEEVSSFVVNQQESWVAYVTQNNDQSTLWIRPFSASSTTSHLTHLLETTPLNLAD